MIDLLADSVPLDHQGDLTREPNPDWAVEQLKMGRTIQILEHPTSPSGVGYLYWYDGYNMHVMAPGDSLWLKMAITVDDWSKQAMSDIVWG